MFEKIRDSSQLQRPGIKTALKNIAIFSFIFLLFIVGIEVLLRYTHLFGAKISWARPDPLLGWSNVPGMTYWHFKENDHPITGRINKYGFRDGEWALEKPPGTYRIAVLGDSYVEAMQVESDNTFLSLTAKALDNNGKRKIELMNFGQSGFTQTDELITLRNKVIQFFPDMVILVFVPGNDIDDISKETATSDFHPFYDFSSNGELILDTSFNKSWTYKIKSFISPLKNNSVVVSLIVERYNAYVSAKRISVKTEKHTINGHLSLATSNPEPVSLMNYNKCKLLIKTMADSCMEKKIKFMLININNGNTYLPEVEEKYKAINATFNVSFFEDDLREYAKYLDIEYLGLQSRFNESYKNSGVLLHWAHWNYKGHQLVAEVLSDKLKEIIHLNE